MYFAIILVLFTLTNGMATEQEFYFEPLYSEVTSCSLQATKEASRIEDRILKGDIVKPEASTGQYTVIPQCVSVRHRTAAILPPASRAGG